MDETELVEMFNNAEWTADDEICTRCRWKIGGECWQDDTLSITNCPAKAAAFKKWLAATIINCVNLM